MQLSKGFLRQLEDMLFLKVDSQSLNLLFLIIKNSHIVFLTSNTFFLICKDFFASRFDEIVLHSTVVSVVNRNKL